MRMHETRARGRLLAILIIIALAIAGGALAAVEAPYLHVRQFLEPGEIFVTGTEGAPQLATLTLTLEGTGPEERFPIDCVLVIDVSASARIVEAKQFAFDLIEHFSAQDRVGLVSFSTTARLDLPLSENRPRLRMAIADLETEGKSAFGEALQLARQELLANARDDAILVEILLTDGQSNIGREPQVEGRVAEEAGIKIVPVGIGHLINRSLLAEFASRTGGLFFPQPTQTAVERIMDFLAVELAAQGVRVEKVLPPEIIYAGAEPTPTRIEENPDGTSSLVWEIGEIALGEEWQTQITLKAKKRGTWPTDLDSSVTLTDFRGVTRRIPVPALELLAIVPPAPPSPPTAKFAYEPALPSTMELVAFTDQSSDSDGQVVAWMWNFGDGEASEEQNPVYSYSRSGTYSVTLVVTDNEGNASESEVRSVTVINREPMAFFACTPEEPRVAVETMLDASGSVDPDGRIVSYAWDFDGDGIFDAETALPEIAHTFLEVGEITVLLKVTDDEREGASVKKTLVVLPSVTATRTIETCLPDDETIAEGTVTVTVTILANTEVHGLTLRETVPEGWTFEPEDNGRATMRKDGETIYWLFLETLLDGDVRTIRYTLTAPSTPLSDPPDHRREQVSIQGVVGSSSPRLSQMVRGEDKVSRVATLPIPVVISRWETEQEKIELCLPEQISFDQIQYAVSLWLSGDPVPLTDNQVVDLDVIQDLIAYWLTDTSVHVLLP